MNYGFIKVASAVPSVKVADCKYNAKQIEKLIVEANKKGVKIICFPELSITAYTCADLFEQQLLLKEAERSLFDILSHTHNYNIIAIVGMPITVEGCIVNAAVVIQQGYIHGIVPKSYLPNYNEFYEKRWFTSGMQLIGKNTKLCGKEVPIDSHLLFRTPKVTFAIELCEDVWATIPPSSFSALQGAEIIFNLSASNECIGKHNYLCSLISQQSARCIAGYVYSSCGFGESTTDVVFAGNALIYENGTLLAASKRFCFEEQMVTTDIDVERIRSERRKNTTFASNKMATTAGLEYPVVTTLQSIVNEEFPIIRSSRSTKLHETNIERSFDPHPFVPKGKALDERCEEIFAIQVSGLAQRLVHTNAQTAVVGISGGLDSTLALLVCVKTFDKLGKDRSGIVGITMPGFGTTDRTYNNAINLMRSLGVTIREINISKAVTQHFSDIGHDPAVHDVTYENSQARERTQLLMDVANQTNGMVIGTGDLSELALGWATYNGDHMSMYGVNASIPKTLVKHLVQWVAENGVDNESRTTLLDIVDTPISPELIPADENGNIKQKTEDLVGPYELHDFFLYNIMRFGFRPAKVYMMATKAFDGVYDKETIKKWLYTFYRRFFNQQFKRSCLPDGPKVGSISISPRGDWRMPSDATSALWLNEVEEL
jgi:NAD+ synthase (glutamine-hydrolysing)